LSTFIAYLTFIGVAVERSTRAFAIAEVVRLLLTTDVLALVRRAMRKGRCDFAPAFFIAFLSRLSARPFVRRLFSLGTGAIV
jgi:hypothetical protein